MSQTAQQKEGDIQLIHSAAHEREDGRIEEPCQGDARRDRQIHNTDIHFPQKRWGTEGRSFDITRTSYLPSLLLSPSGAHARCLNTPASAIGHRWIRWRNLQTGKCVYVCMSSMHNAGLELSVSSPVQFILSTTAFQLWEQRMLYLKRLNTGEREILFIIFFVLITSKDI